MKINGREVPLRRAEPIVQTVMDRDLELIQNALEQIENELYYAYNKRSGRKDRIKFVHGSAVDLMQRVRGLRR